VDQATACSSDISQLDANQMGGEPQAAHSEKCPVAFGSVGINLPANDAGPRPSGRQGCGHEQYRSLMTTAHVHVGDSGGAPMGISPDLLFSQGWGVTELDVHTAAGTEPGVIVNHTVIRGDQRGRTIGFPTANLHPHNRVIPKFGVYATATLVDGTWRRSVTNIGVRPTFGADFEPSIESYIFDFDRELYGDVIRVRFLHRIRDERKFNGIEELKAQIERDSSRALNYFSRRGVKQVLEIV